MMIGWVWGAKISSDAHRIFYELYFEEIMKLEKSEAKTKTAVCSIPDAKNGYLFICL